MLLLASLFLFEKIGYTNSKEVEEKLVEVEETLVEVEEVLIEVVTI